MIEFSLLELREFISITESLNFSLRDYSFISLRLALQRTCDDFKIKNFLDFVRQFQQNPDVKKALRIRIHAHPKELLRDAGSWLYLLNSQKTTLANPQKKVLILDNSFGADIATFFILCQLHNIPIASSVHWFSFCESFTIGQLFEVSFKDMETAESNLQENAADLAPYFLPNERGYGYVFTTECSKAEVRVDDSTLLPLENKYDLIVSQNNSLKYNFSAHERFFKSILAIANNNASFFFGSRENLKQCSCYSELKQPRQDMNYFVNGKRDY